jgi:hypothetical protein
MAAPQALEGPMKKKKPTLLQRIDARRGTVLQGLLEILMVEIAWSTAIHQSQLGTRLVRVMM